MKIGILTYHRAENYGALLQAYATRTYLRSMGHEVSFVDYWPKYHSDYFSIFPVSIFREKNIKGKIMMLLRLALWGIPKLIRKSRLQRFMHKRLGVSRLPLYTNDDCKTEQYDMVVYGSDQIWRKQNLGGVGFDSWYFGSDNVQAYKKVVYAGSMGKIDTSQEDDLFVRDMMHNFLHISVRENDLKSYLNQLGVSSSQVIDPVFLLSREEWERLIPKPRKKEKYILFYNLLNTPESISLAEQLSKEKMLPIREINKRFSVRYLGKRYISTASVEHFLQMIEGAEFVVSNSFHGVAFSLIFEKQFYAVGMGERSNRVVSLLSSLDIKERYIEGGNTLYYDFPIVDYGVVSCHLQNLVECSKKYLNENVS